MRSSPQRVRAILAGLLLAGAAAVASIAPASAGQGIACDGRTDATAGIQAAIAQGGTVTLPAGTCKLTAALSVNKPVTVNGAGQSATYLMQSTPMAGIFHIHAPHVTIQNLHLDTLTANPGAVNPRTQKYKPGFIYSDQSYTSVINVTGVAGSGFGLRIVGPNPCASDLTVGTYLKNVTASNTGTLGAATVDVDCTNGATLENLTVKGWGTALYQDRNVSLVGDSYSIVPGVYGSCEPAVFVTGPGTGISVQNVAGGGKVRITHNAGVTVVNDNPSPGC